MNTISNQRALKSRISRGWAHDSAQFSFYRQSPANHRDIPFQADQQPLVTLGEAVAWAAVFAGLVAFCFFVLGLV